MPSVLIDSGADLLIYGLGEKQIVEIARRLDAGENIKDLNDIKGTCYAVDVRDTPYKGVEVPSFENCVHSKKEYAKSVRVEQDEQDHIRGRRDARMQGEPSRFVAHDFDQHRTPVAGRSRLDPVYIFRCDLDSRLKTERHVGTVDIIIDRFRHADHVTAFHAQKCGRLMRSRTPQRKEAV